jgi:hypothetical protein
MRIRRERAVTKILSLRPCARYSRAVFAVPFNKEAKAVLPTTRAVDADDLNVKSNPPAVNPAIKTLVMTSINMASRRGAG